MSPQLLASLNITAKLRLVDSTEASISGEVTLKWKIVHFAAALQFYVTDLCNEFDAILGNRCLVAHKTQLNFERNTVHLVRHGKSFTLKARIENAEHANALNKVLNFAQAKRCARQGCQSLFVLLKEGVDSSPIASIVNNDDGGDEIGPPDSALPVPELAASIDTIRQAYADVFAEPSGLPPDRGVEHVIPLVPEAIPEFKRMYRLSPDEHEGS